MATYLKNNDAAIQFLVRRYKGTEFSDWNFVSGRTLGAFQVESFHNATTSVSVEVMSSGGQIFNATAVSPATPATPIVNNSNASTSAQLGSTKYVCAYTKYTSEDDESEEYDGRLDVAPSGNFSADYVDEDISQELIEVEIYSNSETQFDVPKGTGKKIRDIIASPRFSNLIRFDSAFQKFIKENT